MLGLREAKDFRDEAFQSKVKNIVHFIGKDIAKFHCMYWPAFLLSAFGSGVLPRQVVVHSHWLKDKRKMSKSIGNVVDPEELLDRFGADSVRLYFLSSGPLLKDTDFAVDALTTTHNQFFVDSYMNLLFRVCGKKILKRLSNEVIKPVALSAEEQEHVDKLSSLFQQIREHYTSYNFPEVCSLLKEAISLSNQYLAHNEFWTYTGPEHKD